MNHSHAMFASNYAQARAKFLQAAAAAHLPVDSYVHPLKGAQGEELAMDVVLEGSVTAEKLLILSSACHGVEGFCGSGVQVQALLNAEWRAYARDNKVAVLYIHALNPYGFAYLSRVTHENVDLNRNFQNFSEKLPYNPHYEALHPLLLPPTWPADAENQAAINTYIQQHGFKAYQAAVMSGQYAFEDGLFFGGKAPTWSHLTLRKVLRHYATSAQHIAWIDVHTGLGPSAVGEKIFTGLDEPEAFKRAQRWWGNVTSIYDGSSSSALLTGMIWMSIYEDCPDAEFTGIALEYGTQPIEEVIEALRGDHWLRLHPDAPASVHDTIKRALKRAFYTETPQWQQRILEQADSALHHAVKGLSAQHNSI